MQRNKKKKKLALGDYLKQNSSGIGAAGNLLGSMIGANAEPTSIGKGVAGGVVKGAATGAAFGPVGAGIGAAVGGISGLLDANSAREQQDQMNRSKMFMEDQFLTNNAGMKNGGRLLSNKLNVQRGGNLQAISDDAVEVKANNPSQTDSVELQDAYVDHNEVIDNQDRVFSDSLLHHTGKTIAKVAKSLEKQKSDNSRFKDANSHIDSKLDQLFNYQEEMKKGGKIKRGSNYNNFTNTEESPDYPDQMATLNSGGSIYIKPENRGKFNATKAATGKTTEELTHSSNPVTKKRAIFAQNAAKWHHAKGGVLRPALYYSPLEGSVANPKKRLDFGGEVPPIKPDPRRVAIDAQMSKNYPGIALDLLDQHNKPVIPGTPDSPATAAIRKGFPATMPMIDTYSQKPLNQVNMNDFDQTGLKPIDTKMASIKGPGMKKGGKIKPKYDLGNNPFGIKKNSVEDVLTGYKPTNQVTTPTPQQSEGMDWNKGITQLATYGPNLLNSSLQKRLQGPPGQQMEQTTKLDRVDPSAQLASIDRDANLTNTLITRNTAQAGNLTSALGSNLARKLAAKNQVYGQTQQINAGIQGNEAFMNTQKQARNAERMNQTAMQRTEFNNKQLQLSSDNLSNLSGKVLQQGRERNLMALDKSKYAIISQQYSDLPAAMKAKYPTIFDYYESQNKAVNKMGGKLKKRNKVC